MSLEAFAGCVDSRLGIVSQIIIEQPEDTGVSVPIVVTAMPPRASIDGEIRTLPSGWGKGLTLSGALLSAIGETMERYSTSLPTLCEFVGRNSPISMAPRLDPREFPLYGDAQYRSENFPYARFNPDIVHPWVRPSG
ncbi:MAG: YcaO-like family protein [Acidobacteriota bacterium]